MQTDDKRTGRRNGAFYNSAFAIRLGFPRAVVEQFAKSPRRAPPYVQAAFYHELHHFYQSIGTTCGNFLLTHRCQHAKEGISFASKVDQALGYIPKPLLTWVDGPEAGQSLSSSELEMLRAEAAEWRDVDEFVFQLAGDGGEASIEVALHSLLAQADGLGLMIPVGRVILRRSPEETAVASKEEVREWLEEDRQALDIPAAERIRAKFVSDWEQIRDLTPKPVLDLPAAPTVASRPIGWTALLEGAAKVTEHLFLRSLPTAEEDDHWVYLDSIYTASLRTMATIFQRHDRQRLHNWLELPFLSDLALSPSLDPEHRLPEVALAKMGMLDVLPGWRFVRACEVAATFDSANLWDEGDSLDDRYRSYAGRICAELGWEVPWQFAERVAGKYASLFAATQDDLFITACELRAAYPSLLALFPHHTQARALTDGLGDLSFGAADSSLHHFWVGRAADLEKREKQVVSMSRLDGRLGAVRWVDQLMKRSGPFDARDDPESFEDSVAAAASSERLEIWEQIPPIPPEKIVFT
jgi:hypothetical protein